MDAGGVDIEAVGDTPVADAARMMAERDCGQIPVVEGKTRKVVGVVTDRDIVCRAVAKNRNPLDLKIESVMSSPAACWSSA